MPSRKEEGAESGKGIKVAYELAKQIVPGLSVL